MKYPLLATKVAPLSVLAISLASLQSPVFADEAVQLNDEGELELSITANRRLQKTNETLAPVSVITRKNIDEIQAQSIIDVLRLQNGVDISRSGGEGSQTSVFLRGSNSNQSLVLVDGVRVSSVTAGSFDWSALPTEQIERIEIVRGARTALYGSDAIAGVIQVFTRKNGGPYASVSLGEFGTKRGSAGFSKSLGKNGNSKLSLNVAAENSDGFSSTNSNAGEFSFNPDDDGYKKRSVTGAFSHDFSDTTKVGINILSSNNKNDFDQGKSETDLQTISAFFQSNINEKWSQKLSVSRSENNLESISSFGASTFDTEREELDWQNNLNLSDKTALVLGANYRKDQGKTNDFDDDISNKALYANLNSGVGKFTFELAGRYDDHSLAGSEFTNQLAAGFALTPKTTAYASYGTAFTAPSINDLYYPGFFGSYAGNPDLEAETSKTFEIGLKSELAKNHKFEASMFRTKVENMIGFTGENNQASNTEKVLLKGVELSYAGSANKFDWGLGASILRATNDLTNERLVRRPNNKFTAKLGYAMTSRTRLGADLISSSSRQDDDFSSFPSTRVKLDSYTLLNLTLNQKINKHMKVGVRVENVTDEDYQLASGFNTPGRAAYLTLSYQ
ncbi:TonB-dependent receptor [uncultured Cocleimonas sp.]|uniref:TonB-dependent receptor domain-containing protein n=1 Tax=uncultured Cocleimonas sp. TaxID=1051587 RepID=UPI0026095AC9|nr:TonB-dependent receptor [uncultured Cocleimonas sp.]